MVDAYEEPGDLADWDAPPKDDRREGRRSPSPSSLSLSTLLHNSESSNAVAHGDRSSAREPSSRGNHSRSSRRHYPNLNPRFRANHTARMLGGNRDRSREGEPSSSSNDSRSSRANNLNLNLNLNPPPRVSYNDVKLLKVVF